MFVECCERLFCLIKYCMLNERTNYNALTVVNTKIVTCLLIFDNKKNTETVHFNSTENSHEIIK